MAVTTRVFQENAQSALSPASPGAAAIDAMTWIMTAGAGAIFIVVAIAAIVAMSGHRARRILAADAAIIAGGVVFPVVTLTALLVWGLTLLAGAHAAPLQQAMRIQVVGEQWWWRVTYADPGISLATANEIVVPAGRPVMLELTSADVIHSFWVPSLAGKLDMIPGRTNVLTFTADKPGLYRGQCAEYCGGAHALMAFVVRVEEPETFESWRAAQAGDAITPAEPPERRGAALFHAYGCGACHTIRGTDAHGTLGPDLTRIGSRQTIAGGILPRNAGTIAAWIASAQHLKPGNAMPSFDVLPGRDTRDIALYLDSLK